MKVLVLHNNNLPFFLRSRNKFTLNGMEILAKSLYYDAAIQSVKIDTYISKELDFLKETDLDLIILPYTLSEDNYLEYSGLLVAAHIRLTPDWGKIETPILFIGPDTKEDIIHLAKYGDIVNSYAVFMTDKSDEKDICDTINSILESSSAFKNNDVLHSQKYHKLIDKLNIKAPANYLTHHSIANEWAILRWADMFNWPDGQPGLNDISITDLLYFKFQSMKVAIQEGERERFTKSQRRNHPRDPKINGIEGKRIVYIDDEGNKGWYQLIGNIIKNSGATILTYFFKKGVKKDDLLVELKTYIKENDADCYLIDLRLHDEDFTLKSGDEYLGVKLAKYIKTLNNGNQIVMFTASNKTWNYEKLTIDVGVTAYAIKESPEYNYSRIETYENFVDFSNKVRKACQQSYLKHYYEELNQLSNDSNNFAELYEFVDLLDIMNGEENNVLKKSAALAQIVFLESYIKEKDFSCLAGDVYLGDDLVGNITGKLYFKIEESGTHKNVVDVLYYPKKDGKLRPHNYEEAISDKDITKIVAPLLEYFKINIQDVKLTVKIKNERNRNIAHGGHRINLTIQELRTHFENVIIPVLKKMQS